MNELVDLLRSLPVGGFSALTILSIVVLMIYKGLLIPATTYTLVIDNWKTMLDQKTSENDTLKEAYRLSEKARESSAGDVKQLLVLAQTTVHLLESIQERAEEAKPHEVARIP